LNARRLSKWEIFLIASFTLLLIVEVGLVIQQERTQIFAVTAQRTGSALIDFAQTRAQVLRRKSNESFYQYELRISAENAKTQLLYAKQYEVEVARFREEFARRGLKTPELDMFYQRPESAIAIREIGRTLFDMGTELRSENTKGWLRRLVHVALLRLA
jgi:hypothetical protein